MNKPNLFVCFVCVIVWALQVPTFAQSSCSQILKEAQKNYELGILEPITDKLSGCLANGFTEIEKLQAYRLIILANLFLDNDAVAEKYMYNLLRFEPDYKPNEALDPIEYTNLYKSFRVQPVISVGVLLGANRTAPRILNDYSTGNTSGAPSVVNAGFNFNVGATVDIAVYKRLFATVDLFYVNRSYNVSSDVIPQVSRVSSAESMSFIDMPVSLKWHPGSRKLRPFVRGGVGMHYIFVSESQMLRTEVTKSQSEFEDSKVNLLPQRTPLSLTAIAGAGLTYKLGYGFITLDARYYFGLSNMSVASKRYTDFSSQITNFGYIDKDFVIDNIMINVGYMYSIYGVKKNKRTF